MTYERTESGAIQVSIPVEGTEHQIVLRAQNVRKERTGVHATVTVGVDGMILEEDTFNVERREDRTRLGNAALKNPIIQDLAPRLKLILDHELLLFLRGLWDFEVGKNEPERRGGALTRTSPPWLVKPYILAKSGTILFGPPGRGKSWTAYAMAVMCDAGYQFFYDVPVDGAPAMIVNLERSAESVDARLGDINVTLGLPRERALLRLDRRGRKFQDVADSVARVVEREGVALVVLDSLSRAGYGDLNANEDTNRGMDALNGLGTAWLAIGHTPRGDETHLFGCHSEDTEVLTRRGWLPHQLLDLTDEVAAYDMGAETLRWEHPEAIHEYAYSGEMYALGGQSQRMLVTPTHRMVIQNKSRSGVKGQWGSWRFSTAQEMPKNTRVPYATTFENPRADQDVFDIGEARFPADDFLRFIGWWVSEGSLVAMGPTLTQQAGPLADAMASGLDALGLRYRTAVVTPKPHQRGTATIHHHRVIGGTWLGRWLAENCGKGAGSKKLPALVWDLSTRQQRIVLDALIEGDGWSDARPVSQRKGGAGGSMHYTTTSVQLADDVQRLAIELGMSGFVRPRGRAQPHHLDRYTVLIGHRRHVEIKAERGNIRTEPYQGRVYCLTVPSGAYLTRREGAMAISGNSQMQDAAADVMVQLLSEERMDQWGKIILGVGVKGMKANDVRRPPLTIMAYEFDDIGLTAIRKSRPGEFLTIENTSANMDVRGQVAEYLRSEGAATATAISRDTGIARTTISTLLNGGAEFERERRGNAVLFRLRQGDVSSFDTPDNTSAKGSVVRTTSYRDDTSNDDTSNHVSKLDTSDDTPTSQQFWDEEDEE